MDSSGTLTPYSEPSERPAQVPIPANQRASDVTSFWRTRDHLLYTYYGLSYTDFKVLIITLILIEPWRNQA